mgnify:CR=1 FL=1
MADKTIVTKEPVTESGDNGSKPPGEGKNQVEKDLENKVRENLRAEYERKEKVLSDKLALTEDRLAELEEKAHLTESQQRELERLESRKDNIESELDAMEHSEDKNVRLWVAKAKKEAEKARDEAKSLAYSDVFSSLAEDWMEEKAVELGLEYKDFRKSINPYAGKYLEKNQLSRAKLAFRDWKRVQDLEKREADLKAKEEKAGEFSEGGGRKASETTLDEDLKSGDNISAMKKLGL